MYVPASRVLHRRGLGCSADSHPDRPLSPGMTHPLSTQSVEDTHTHTLTIYTYTVYYILCAVEETLYLCHHSP